MWGLPLLFRHVKGQAHDGLYAQYLVRNVPPKPQHSFAENLTGSTVSQSHQFRSPRVPCFRSTECRTSKWQRSQHHAKPRTRAAQKTARLKTTQPDEATFSSFSL